MTRKAQNFTVGDLVVAVTDAALEISKNEERAYQIAGVVVNKILKTSAQRAARRLDSTDEWRRFH